MAFTLIVTNPFAGHTVGEPITDPTEIETILGGENAGSVVKVASPDPVPSKSTK